MTKRILISLFIFSLVFAGVFAIRGRAQTTTAPASKAGKALSDPLASLPASDGVISVDAQRLLNEMLPRVLADNAPRLAQVNARIDLIKTRTGIDVRTFDRVAVGMRFVNGTTPNSLKVETVALARGHFNAQSMLSAGLLAHGSKYKYRQQKYGGKVIYIFNGADLFGRDQLPKITAGEEGEKSGNKAAEVADNLLQRLMNFSGDVAISAIDANTLAVGQPGRVRAAIDAGAGRGKVDSALLSLASRGDNAVVGYGINAPQNASRFFGFDNDQIAKNIDAIRHVYGFVGQTSTGFEMRNFMRTSTSAEAQEVYNMLEGFKDLGGFLASSLSGDKGKLAQSALENLKITKDGQEVIINLELAQADVAMLVRVLDKQK